MKLRRWVLRWMVVPLVLGAVTCVGVAWGIAAWMPQRGWRATTFADGLSLYGLTEYRYVGCVRRAWFSEHLGANPLEGAFGRPIDAEVRDPAGISRSRLGWPRWGNAAGLLESRESFEVGPMEHATGWPVVAGWYDVKSAFTSGKISYRIQGGISLRNNAGLDGATYQIRALPLRPIWIGVVIDTLFFAALWMFARGGFRGLPWQWLRHRRGLCARCAYDLTGVPVRDGGRVCRECGASEVGAFRAGRR